MWTGERRLKDKFFDLNLRWGIIMFKPVFSYTDRIVHNLTYIAESKAIIKSSPLIPEWEVSLRKDAIIRSAHSSTAIEGNPLTLEEVSALTQGREVMARRKDQLEVKLSYSPGKSS